MKLTVSSEKYRKKVQETENNLFSEFFLTIQEISLQNIKNVSIDREGKINLVQMLLQRFGNPFIVLPNGENVFDQSHNLETFETLKKYNQIP